MIETTCKVCSEVFERSTSKQPKNCPTCENTRQRVAKYKKRYGLTETQYNKYMEQKTCEICNVEVIRQQAHLSPQSAVLDHCHDTGTIRGVLCKACNAAIGLFGSDISKLKSAITYLERSR